MASDRPITVVVEFEVQTETTSRDEWLAAWQERADDAFAHEPFAPAYEAAVSVEDASRVLVFERYENGDAGLQAHMERPAHRELGELMGARRMIKSRVLANIADDIPNYGWWARPEHASPAHLADHPLTLLCMRFGNDAQRDRFIELSGEHARYCLTAEPDTLVYSGAIARDDLESTSPLAAGDLVFVMVCTDDAAVEKHATDPQPPGSWREAQCGGRRDRERRGLPVPDDRSRLPLALGDASVRPHRLAREPA